MIRAAFDGEAVRGIGDLLEIAVLRGELAAGDTRNKAIAWLVFLGRLDEDLARRLNPAWTWREGAYPWK